MAAGYGLIGRVSESAALGAHARQVLQGRGSIVLLSGEAGVGKTMLARGVLREHGLERVDGVARPEGAMAYGPIVELIRTLVQTRPQCLPQAESLRSPLAA